MGGTYRGLYRVLGGLCRVLGGPIQGYVANLVQGSYGIIGITEEIRRVHLYSFDTTISGWGVLLRYRFRVQDLLHSLRLWGLFLGASHRLNTVARKIQS